MDRPHIHSVGFTCSETTALAGWFERWLGCRRHAVVDHDADAYCALVGLAGARLRRQILAIGSEQLELTQVLDGGPHRPGRPVPADSRSNDLWFQHICLVVPAIDAVAPALQEQILARALLPISSEGPQRLPDRNSAAAGIVAFKLHDPDGHPLELLQFPPDKGDARWHQLAKVPVLGIDHSAIGVSDPPRTARFYGDLLGLRHGGGGINSGPEQELLDGLQDAQVQIDAWRASEGMGIEALAYRVPTDGRPQPADFSAQDLWHWQIRLEVDDLERVAAGVGASGGHLISGGILDLEGCLGENWSRALQVADPDGHRLQLVCR
ncbi:VOC family protein [Cyanobium sp. FGCU-6]|jgi:catechol 2,3-dioxygenase-like lactoylglutathione lyase family enzyme|nr:VOC family protein [Cyanobium sp. FGCU6]MEB3320786.1 VOC family protein [Cyanobium sp.]